MQIRNRVRELRLVSAAELKANPKNWRKHPTQQREALRAILAEIGYADALLARETEEGLVLIDGHLRADLTPDETVPVLILDLDDREADKLLLTLDPLGAMADADAEKLADLLRGVEVDQESLKRMLDDLAIEHAIDLSPGAMTGDLDETPQPPDEATTRPGDLWILGEHRLLCGDSSKPEDVDRLLAGATIQLVNTDPPYNVKVEPRSNNAIAAGNSSFSNFHHQRFDVANHPEKSKPTSRKMRAKDRPLANDFVSEEEFDRLLSAWFGNMARVLDPGRGFYIWGGYANVANYPPVLKAMKLYFSQAIIWVKEHPVLTRKDFMGNHEWCFYGWKEGAAHLFVGPNNATDVWSVKKVNPTQMVHLTEKPVELAVRAMQYSSRAGENVLDLFGGSGSTLIAAEQTGRKAFLMELDTLYCDVIVQRWEKLSGKKATRETAQGQKATRRRRRAA